jgi:hypothetical protein
MTKSKRSYRGYKERKGMYNQRKVAQKHARQFPAGHEQDPCIISSIPLPPSSRHHGNALPLSSLLRELKSETKEEEEIGNRDKHNSTHRHPLAAS